MIPDLKVLQDLCSGSDQDAFADADSTGNIHAGIEGAGASQHGFVPDGAGQVDHGEGLENQVDGADDIGADAFGADASDAVRAVRESLNLEAVAA